MKICTAAPAVFKAAATPRESVPAPDGFSTPIEATPDWAALGKMQLQPSPLNQRLDRLFEEARHSPNPVLASVEPIVRGARHVRLNLDALKAKTQEVQPDQLKVADWKWPPYKPQDDDGTIDFFMLMNTINFLFFEPDTGEKYKVTVGDKEFKGADAMVACLNRALDEGIPLLDADYLANVSRAEMAHIFRGNIELPLLDERTAIFNEVGQVLKEKYDGSFANLTAAAGGRAFDDGNGMVERLTRDFPSFRDSSPLPGGGEAVFNKRAQLAVGMLTSRLAGSGRFECSDVDQLTVFADYQLPRGLRAMGVLEYDEELAHRVDTGLPIEKDSRMEQELRAFTVVAGKLLEEELKARPGFGELDARALDTYLWMQGRQDPDSRPHVTLTTAY